MKEDDILAYFPPASRDHIRLLMLGHEFELILVPGRKTKLGDFRPASALHSARITLNRDIPPMFFLIIFMHELAHFYVWKELGRNTKPHGWAWKQTYKELMLPVLHDKVFPERIITLLAAYLLHPKATLAGESELCQLLWQADRPEINFIQLRDLEDGSIFTLANGKTFKRISKRRKRIIGLNLENNRLYLIQPGCQVLRSNS